MMRIIVAIIFLIGLWYIILPTPTSVNDFSALPGSIKSVEPGDTSQNYNIAAYYTDERRKDATSFYKNELQKLHCQTFSLLNPFCIIPPIRLNLPVEYAFVYVRDQAQSTYLEAYLYPFRDTLYVNGYEPYDINGVPFSKKSYPILISGKFYDSKVTLRYYPSKVIARTMIYLLTWAAMVWMCLLIKRSMRKNG